MQAGYSIVLVFVHFSACLFHTDGLNCDPGPLVEKHEGRKPCVYLDTKHIKTIGVGYNMQNKGAAAVFHSIGADFNKFNNGPTTPSKVKCNCSAVPCLTNGQINQLFALSLKTAVDDAQTVIPSFLTLCCPVQNVMVDMAFTFGPSRFAKFTEFGKLIQWMAWKSAGDDLSMSKWCIQDARSRCMEGALTVTRGCGCKNPYPQACGAQASKCCYDKSQNTCCKGQWTFHSFVTKTFEEMLCCPLPSATCCPNNKCCPRQYPICCPNNKCCPSAFPICGSHSGTCYRSGDNMAVEGQPSVPMTTYG